VVRPRFPQAIPVDRSSSATLIRYYGRVSARGICTLKARRRRQHKALSRLIARQGPVRAEPVPLAVGSADNHQWGRCPISQLQPLSWKRPQPYEGVPPLSSRSPGSGLHAFEPVQVGLKQQCKARAARHAQVSVSRHDRGVLPRSPTKRAPGVGRSREALGRQRLGRLMVIKHVIDHDTNTPM
jgi:hypothetical protein